MATFAASGASAVAVTKTAVTAAIHAAVTQLGKKKPTLAFLFVAPRHDLKEGLVIARDLLPGAAVLGCTTAGEITERGNTNGGVSVLVVSSEEMQTTLGYGSRLSKDHQAVAQSLCYRF